MNILDKCKLLLIFVTVLLNSQSAHGISPCGLNRFWCSNNRCVFASQVCDTVDDCRDNSDERSCNECTSGSFSCGPLDDCIEPELVCDSDCDCGNCEDEQNCYHRTGGFFNPLSLVFPMAIIIGVISCYGIYQAVRGKICDKPQARRRRSTVQPEGSRINEPPENGRSDIIDDLPPAYDSIVNNNSMIVIDAESLNGGPVTPLPTYEDATAPGTIVVNPSTDSTQPPPPSYDSVQLPQWVSSRENGETTNSDRSYNVIYYNRSPRHNRTRENRAIPSSETTNAQLPQHANTENRTSSETSTDSSITTSSSTSRESSSSSSNTSSDSGVENNQNVQASDLSSNHALDQNAHKTDLPGYDNQAYEPNEICSRNTSEVQSVV